MSQYSFFAKVLIGLIGVLILHESKDAIGTLILLVVLIMALSDFRENK